MSMWGDYIQEFLNSQQATAGANPGGVNRSGPATPPPIPMPNNQNPNAGGFMGQAFSLSGVPTGLPQQQMPQPPQAQPTPAQGGQLPGGMQIPPQYLQYIQALLGQYAGR